MKDVRQELVRLSSDWFDDKPFIPELTVYDMQAEEINTGLLDAQGKPIKRRSVGMEPIGFIRFPR